MRARFARSYGLSVMGHQLTGVAGGDAVSCHHMEPATPDRNWS